MELDEIALTKWLDTVLPGGGRLDHLRPVTGGTQNILVRFTYAERDLVLRMAPAGAWGDRSKTMLREHRVLAALESTEVPHPRPIALCTDESILGATFYIMEAVGGFNPAEGLPPALVHDSAYQFDAGMAMADCIAALGSVDVTAQSLAGFGRPEGWLERQVDKWARQLDGYRGLDGFPGVALPHRAGIEAWLRARPPVAGRPGLLHGDFHFGNVLLDSSSPRITAVVDWELATIGDPLVELGHLLATWPDEHNSFIHPQMNFTGLPGKDSLIERYSARSERDMSRLDWYRVLACFRLGALLEGSYARAHSEPTRWDVGLRLHTIAVSLFDQAAHICGAAA